MIRRLVIDQLRERLTRYQAVALIGPRQSGKTTLAKSLGGVYFDLEQRSERLRLDLEWDRLTAGKALIVLDEAQSWPDVFARLRGAIDHDRTRMGRFLLLGSVSPALMVHVSESLAGRLSLVELTPFLLSELTTKASRERRWLCGGYPDGGVLEPTRYPRWQMDYLSLLSQRDLPTWGLPAKPQTTDRLLRMLAALHGQVWNASQVGQSLGLSYHTVNGYLEYLTGAFLIRRLPSYHANIRKRLIKSPKVYWRDCGLLHALLNVPDGRALLTQPWVGASWEGFVIEQALGELSSRGRQADAYYFRTSDQYELDLVLDFGNELWAVEVKLTSTPTIEDMTRLDRTADMIRASHRFLVSQTSRSSGDERRVSCNLPTFLQYVQRNTSRKIRTRSH
jgi:predicted AAA+ superfamily ATPase